MDEKLTFELAAIKNAISVIYNRLDVLEQKVLGKAAAGEVREELAGSLKMMSESAATRAAAGAMVLAAWAAKGLALLVFGFIPDKRFRVSGLLVFAMVMFKLLLVDHYSGAETIQRNLSFIGASVVLLVASYAYARFTKNIADEPREKINVKSKHL